jgi:hypothetical protein
MRRRLTRAAEKFTQVVRHAARADHQHALGAQAGQGLSHGIDFGQTIRRRQRDLFEKPT